MKLFLDKGLDPVNFDWVKANTYKLEGWYIIREKDEYLSLVSELTHENMPHVISFGQIHGLTSFDCAEHLMEHCIRFDLQPPIMFCHDKDQVYNNAVESLWSKYLNFYYEKQRHEDR